MEQEQRDKILKLIDDLTPIPDIAILMDMSESELRSYFDDPSLPEFKIFRKKIAEVQRNIRQRDIQLYVAGSPTAATSVSDHLHKMMQSL